MKTDHDAVPAEMDRGEPMNFGDGSLGHAFVNPSAPDLPEGMHLADTWGRFLLRPEKAEEQTEGGIWVGDQNKAPVGVVVQGPVGVGRRVLFKQYHGTQTTINGEELMIVDGEHLLLWLGDDDKVE